jgi:hypothetical protein
MRSCGSVCPSPSISNPPDTQVMGRSEDEELPTIFDASAAAIVRVVKSEKDQSVLPVQTAPAPLAAPFGAMRESDGFKFKLLSSLTVRDAESVALGGCASVVKGPVLFLTRVEYANLFHTSTGKD